MTLARACTVLLALFALRAGAVESPRVAAIDFSIVAMKKKLGSFYAEQLAVRLEAKGLHVTTQKDIQSVLSLERQKQLLGCADDASSCAVELAGALGVEALVTGQVAKVGKSFQLNVRILSAKDATPIFVFSKLLKNEEDVLEALEEAANGAADKLVKPPPPEEAKPAPEPKPVEPKLVEVTKPAPPVEPAKRTTFAPWLVVGAGAASLITSGVFFGLYGSAWGRLGAAPVAEFPPAEAQRLAEAGNTYRWVAIATAALGASLVGAGLAWRFLSNNDTAVVVVPFGPGVAVSMEW